MKKVMVAAACWLGSAMGAITEDDLRFLWPFGSYFAYLVAGMLGAEWIALVCFKIAFIAIVTTLCCLLGECYDDGE